MNTYPSQVADKYMMRFPDGLRHKVKVAAATNHRSMNAEIIFHLERALASSEAVEGEGLDSNTPSAAN